MRTQLTYFSQSEKSYKQKSQTQKTRSVESLYLSSADTRDIDYDETRKGVDVRNEDPVNLVKVVEPSRRRSKKKKKKNVLSDVVGVFTYTHTHRRLNKRILHRV